MQAFCNTCSDFHMEKIETCQINVTKQVLDHGTGIDTSDLTVKKYFIALKAEVDKLGISKVFDVPTNLNNIKTKVDDLVVCKLKTVPVDLKNSSDVVDNEVV